MLEELELLSYFDAVCGADADGRLAKADLIQMGMDRAGARPQQTVLVGDSLYDAEGARQAGVAFLAVTYGLGSAPGGSGGPGEGHPPAGRLSSGQGSGRLLLLAQISS